MCTTSSTARALWVFLWSLLLVPIGLSAATIYLHDGRSIEEVSELRQIDEVFLYTQNGRQRTVEVQRVASIQQKDGEITFQRLDLKAVKVRDEQGRTAFNFLVNGEHVARGNWAEDGVFKLSGKGLPDGVYQQFYDSGKLEREWTIRDNRLNGSSKLYYDSGILEREGMFVDGREAGVSRLYYRSGALKGESGFSEGRKHGLTRLFYESGHLRSAMTFEQGKAQGLQKMFYPDGSLLAEVEFRESVKHGKMRQYYQSGVLKMEGHYREDRLEGVVTNYWPSGRVKKRQHFINGRILVEEDADVSVSDAAAQQVVQGSVPPAG